MVRFFNEPLPWLIRRPFAFNDMISCLNKDDDDDDDDDNVDDDDDDNNNVVDDDDDDDDDICSSYLTKQNIQFFVTHSS